MRFIDDIPESVFSQMRTCQTAANEFLRQYWSSIFPPPSDPQTLGTSTPAQKAAKAAKMIGYLASTQDKVDAIIKAASSAGAEPAKIEVVSRLSNDDACLHHSQFVAGHETSTERRRESITIPS